MTAVIHALFWLVVIQFATESTSIATIVSPSYGDSLHTTLPSAGSQLAKMPTIKGRPNRTVRSAGPDVPTDEQSSSSCDRFIEPNRENSTFFSPLDPRSSVNTYPSKIDCTFTLEAPAGYLIQLDFRNVFYIEPSPDCEFDYLEVRDGQYGFSKELGRFCGVEFPSIIYSSDRYLWLHFHSDENIEYEGFQAVYKYMPRPTSSIIDEELCMFTKDGSEGFISNDEISKSIINNTQNHKISLDCLWRIEVEPRSKILLSFDTFDLDKKNDCDSNFIDIFGMITDIPSRLKNFCGVIAETVVSNGHVLHVRFFAEHNALLKTRFKILYTAFRPKEKSKECTAEEFDCDDDTCIDKNLYCNTRNNCKFSKDEVDCPKAAEGDSGNLIIIIVVFCLILAAMITAFLFNCIRKLVRDQKIIREHIRQSKESKLDEAGRISLKRSLENINRIVPSNQSTIIPSMLPRNMPHPLDNESSRQYPDNLPLHAAEQKPHIFKHNYRQQEAVNDLLPSARNSSSDKCASDDGGNNGGTNMCDMACQTRSSLFGSTLRQSRDESGSSSPATIGGPLRFSTFGYAAASADAVAEQRQRQSDTSAASHTPSCPNSGSSNSQLQQQLHHHHHQHQPHPHHHHHHQQQQQQQQHSTPDGIPPPPPPVVLPTGSCTKHSQHHQHHHHPNQLTDHSKGAKKTEESRIFVDIRNSAPDVIIMTSH